MTCEKRSLELQKLLNTTDGDYIRIAEYNHLVNFIGHSLQPIVLTANQRMPDKCTMVRPNYDNLVGWHLGSRDYNCYKANYYLLPDENIVELHHFVPSQFDPYVSLTNLNLRDRGSLSDKDYEDMRLIFNLVFAFGLGVGLSNEMARLLNNTKIMVV